MFNFHRRIKSETVGKCKLEAPETLSERKDQWWEESLATLRSVSHPRRSAQSSPREWCTISPPQGHAGATQRIPHTHTKSAQHSTNIPANGRQCVADVVWGIRRYYVSSSRCLAFARGRLAFRRVGPVSNCLELAYWTYFSAETAARHLVRFFSTG